MRGVSLMVLVFGACFYWGALAQTSEEYTATGRCTVSELMGATHTRPYKCCMMVGLEVGLNAHPMH